MKTYTATLTTAQVQTVSVTVADDTPMETVEQLLCEAGNIGDGEFSNDLDDIEEMPPTCPFCARDLEDPIELETGLCTSDDCVHHDKEPS